MDRSVGRDRELSQFAFLELVTMTMNGALVEPTGPFDRLFVRPSFRSEEDDFIADLFMLVSFGVLANCTIN